MTPVPPADLRRVLLTADPIGGVWPFALELTAALSASGVEVILAVIGGRVGSAQRRAAELAGAVALHEAPWRLEWMTNPWEDVRAAGEWLLDLERYTEPDIVHLNQLAFGALPWRAPPVVTVHSCVLSWWRAVHRTDAPAEWMPYRRSVEASLRAVPLVLAPSAAMLRDAERLYGPFRSAHVIPNARDGRSFTPGRKEELILAAGRCWDEAKNLTALARMAPSLPWPVYVAGDTAHPDGDRRPLPTVHALGPLPPRQLAWWLGRAAVFVHPARYEPFGLAVLEAALSECALVLGDIESLRELWQGAALFVDPLDLDHLRRTLRRVALDAEFRRALAAAARRHASRFGPRQFGAAHLAAYRLALARGAGLEEETAACA
jgi:glycosyltransferase involved in cell wall biosynthesis